MKTVKQLRSIFIQSLMWNEQQERNIQNIKQGIITSAHPKVNEKLCDFVEEYIYKGHRTIDVLRKLYGQKFEPTVDYCEDHNISVDDVKRIINSGETERRINSYFDKYRIQLNELLCTPTSED